MKNGNVPIISISLTKDEARRFKELCMKETRGVSDEFRHMLKFYLENKDKVKQ